MKVFLIGFLFLTIIATGFALPKCFECESDEASCKGEVKDCPTGLANPYCYKIEGEKEGKKKLKKGCVLRPEDEKNDSCEDKATIDGIIGKACYCKKDECNNAEIAMMSKILTISSVFIAIFTQQFL